MMCSFQGDGIHPNPDKIKAVSQFPNPKTQKQFFELTGYYRKIIKEYVKVTQQNFL